MSPSTATTASRAALGYRDFRFYLVARFLSILSLLMLGVAVGWQVYDLTRDPFDLGLIGLVQFLPQIALSLVTGAVADKFDRRIILLVCLGCEAVGAAGLAALSWSGAPSLAGIFGVLIVVSVARAFAGPALQSATPLLVPKEHFPNAVAWSSMAWQIAVIAGPATGGFAYAAGAHVVYSLCTAGLVCAALATFGIRTRLKAQAVSVDASMVERLFAGIRFVWNKPIVLGAISLDLFAVLFGGATALLPIFARDILHVGPWGLGILRSAPAVGAALTAAWIAHHPMGGRAGVKMFTAVALFGAATVVFGLSDNFWLSLGALAVLGASDMISVIVRQTLIQLETPDEMRGRVAAVNLVFIGASNELGEFESGVTAAWWGAVPAVIVGGLGTLAVVALWSWLFKDLRRVDRLT